MIQAGQRERGGPGQGLVKHVPPPLAITLRFPCAVGEVIAVQIAVSNKVSFSLFKGPI